jgi:hypothetical protein
MKPKLLTILFFSTIIGVTSGCAGFQIKQITWEKVSQEQLNNLCLKDNQSINHYKNGLWGCAIYSRDTNNNLCRIYTLETLETLETNSSREQYILGHETMHCFKGNFHK